MQKLSEEYEKAIRIQIKLEALGLGVSYYVATKFGEDAYFGYLKIGKRGEYGLDGKSEDEVVELAKILAVPSYTQLTSVCADTMDNVVYIDKEVPVTILSITRKGVEVKYLEESRTVVVPMKLLWTMD